MSLRGTSSSQSPSPPRRSNSRSKSRGRDVRSESVAAIKSMILQAKKTSTTVGIGPLLNEFVGQLGQSEKEWLVRELGMAETVSASSSVSRSESPTPGSREWEEHYIDPERHIYHIKGRKVQCITRAKPLFKKYNKCEMVKRLIKSKKHYHLNRPYFMLRPTVGLLGGFRNHVMSVLHAWENWRTLHIVKTTKPEPLPAPAFDESGALNKCMSYWMNRQLAAAWVRYREFYAEVLQQREALMGAMLKWLKKALTMGWNSWREQYEDMLRQREIARKALHRWCNQKLSAALNTWYSWLLDMIAQRQAAVRAALRWRKSKVSAALNKWLYVADQSCFDADAHSVYQQYMLMKAAEGLKHWRTQTTWALESEDIRVNAPCYGSMWHNMLHLERFFRPWRMDYVKKKQRKLRFDKMEEMFLNKASDLRRQFFCNPAQSEQMLLESWEDMDSMLHAALSPQHGQCRYKVAKKLCLANGMQYPMKRVNYSTIWRRTK